ncbi:nucleotidyltransferase family protein [Methanobacterium aggregans]|uniref:nucleotidyltransferase family protein n=1 Tax=Methanobacterium aggregans TaxID=1615586 RepID=UPI001AE7BE88|nr:NTP transferase domain-containing protein [Methanobacterium aggregans]MBP2045604.1 molybdenum cofactor cytidylyltransferase [Methanobacterium aggregans]
MISAIVTAAGKNRRMIADQKSRGIEVKHKLLLDLHGKPVIIRTIENVLNAGVDEVVVVLGHFSHQIIGVIDDFDDERVKIVENPDVNVELSETLLNGAFNVESGLCLCVAADQPTITTETFKNLIKKASEYFEPENIVSVMARQKTGFLDSAEGLGMPFVCHSDLLKKYLPGREDNLNPILRNMVDDDVVFYGSPALNDLELVNINRWDDYLLVLEKMGR